MLRWVLHLIAWGVKPLFGLYTKTELNSRLQLQHPARVPQSQPLDFGQIQRVLITKLRYHGDVLLASPVFRALKRHYPHVQVDGLVYQETEDMLSLSPFVDRLFCIDRRWKKQGIVKQFREETRLRRSLKARQYDLLIHLTDHWRGFLLKQSLGIPYAVVADYPRRQGSWVWQRTFSHIYPLPAEQPITWTHMDALNAIGVPLERADYKLAFAIAPEDHAVVDALLQQHGLLAGRFVVVHPTSRFFYKCWPPAIMARYLDRLMSRGVQVALTAAPSTTEREYVAALLAAVEHAPVDLSGQLSLKQLGAIISKAACFVGVDSAPMHIATAVDVPIVAMFGATNSTIWAPQTDKAIVLTTRERQQRPPIVNGSRPNTLANCILDIDEASVVEATLRQLRSDDRPRPTSE